MDNSYRIGNNLIVRPESDELVVSRESGRDHMVKLEPRLMRVLDILASSAGTVVPRDRFLSEVWENYESADEALTQAVSKLRKTVADSGVTEQIIDTVPKKGYKLKLPVLPVSKDPEKDPSTLEELKPRQHRHLTFALLVLIISLLGWLIYGALNDEPAYAPEAPSTPQEQTG